MPTERSAPSQLTPSFAESDGLAAAVETLEADPAHLPAWLRTSLYLHQDPEASDADRHQARLALESVAAALGEAGHLPLALFCCRRLAELGDERQATARLMVLANAYGKTSSRVDPTVRPRPPAPPRVSSGIPQITDGPALRARAVAALRKAAARAIHMQQSGQRGHDPLPPVPLFSALLPDAFVKLARQMQVLDLPESALVFAAGDPGDALYVIARGTVRIERAGAAGPVLLARLRAGSFFGEMALLSGAPRSADAIAETPLLLLRADKAALESLSERDPQIAAVLAEHARRRLLQNVMLTSPLFRVLQPAEREALMARFSFRSYEPGQVLIEEAHAGQELLVLLSGQVEVARESGPGADQRLTTLGPGDVIGEIALLLDRPTSAIVRALLPTTVLALHRQDFTREIDRLPEAHKLLLELASQRLNAGAALVSERLPRQEIEEVDERDIVL
jgi:cAMP-dependent protein kinase regulator